MSFPFSSSITKKVAFDPSTLIMSSVDLTSQKLPNNTNTNQSIPLPDTGTVSSTNTGMDTAESVRIIKSTLTRTFNMLNDPTRPNPNNIISSSVKNIDADEVTSDEDQSTSGIDDDVDDNENENNNEHVLDDEKMPDSGNTSTFGIASTVEGDTQKKKKTVKACDQCRFRKVKCDGNEKCSRCLKTDSACTYNYVFKAKKPKKQDLIDKPKRKRGRPRKIDAISDSPLPPNHTAPLSTEMISYPFDSHNHNLTPASTTSTNSLMDQRKDTGMIKSNSGYTSTSSYPINQQKSTFNYQSNSSPSPLTYSSISNLASSQNPTNFPNGYPYNNAHLRLPTVSMNNTSGSMSQHHMYQNIHPQQQHQQQQLIQGNGMNSDYISYPVNQNPTTPAYNDTNSQLSAINLQTPGTAKVVDDPNVENRLHKLESMLALLIDKVSNPSSGQSTNSISNSNSNSHTTPCSNTSVTNYPNSMAINDVQLSEPIHESLDMSVLPTGDVNGEDEEEDTAAAYELSNMEQCHGLFSHTSIFFLSKVGLIALESKMKDPKQLIPLRKILSIASPCEERFLSVWNNPIPETQLTPLPPRKMINYLLDELTSCVFIVHLLDMDHLKKKMKLYCDHRDGLIPEPKFTYSDFLLMNTSLLLAAEVVIELIRTKTIKDNDHPGLDYFKGIQDLLLDNSIFYYVRVSVISGGLSAISASLMLAFYADCLSMSRAAYLISSSAIRQAQEFGLHLEDAYRGLETRERNLKLNIWWTCYIVDKEMCIRWGHAAVIHDDDVTAPPLPGFEAFWSPNSFTNTKPIVKETARSRMGIEIQAALVPLLENLQKTTVLEQFILADFAILSSRIYNNFLRANSMKNLNKKEMNLVLQETLHELDCWRQNIPSEIRPRIGGDDDLVLHDNITRWKKNKSRLSLYKMYMAVEFHVRYHHLRLMIYRAYIKNWLIEFSEPFQVNMCMQQLNSARSIMKFSLVDDGSSDNFTNHFMFYQFHAFILMSTFYIYSTKKSAIMESDYELLIDFLMRQMRGVSTNHRMNERGKHITSVLKAMLYASYHACVDRYGPMEVKGIEFLSDIHDIRLGKRTPEDLILTSPQPKDAQKPKPFCKMPYYESNKQHPLATSISTTSLPEPNSTRTPSVQFLLSPAHTLGATNSDMDGMDFSKDNFFHNMLNIPNYFTDPLAED